MKKKLDIYERITDRIVKQLEKGVAPWLTPWDHAKAAKAGMGGYSSIWPSNAISGHYYSGANVLMCWMHLVDLKQQNTDMPLFLTYKQAVAAKGYVKKGESGCPVIGYRDGVQTIEDERGETKQKRFRAAFGHTVFHISQCEGVQLPKREVVELVGLTSDKQWQAFLKATGASIKHGGARAFYNVGADTVVMPTAKSFKSPALYKSVACHELTHWTGHETRLKRNLSSMYGTTGYAEEELIAELGAAFLCAKLGIPMTELRHAEYIATWIKGLKDNKRAIITAASAATKAVQYIEERAASALKPAKPKRERGKRNDTSDIRKA